jgi:hypothetical protein
MRASNGILAALAALGLAAAACTPDAKKVAARSESLADSLVALARAPAPVPPVRRPRQPDGGVSVYLDGTESMRGFFQCDSGAVQVASVLKRLTTAFGVDSLTLFGVPEANAAPEASFTARAYDRTLACGEGIGRYENPDYLLYQEIERDSSGRVTVYLTDGVQSANSVATPSPSIRALERWVGSGKALAILAFRGTFVGDAWSEEKGDWAGWVRKEDRPFYAFVFAPSAERMNAFLARLPRELSGSAAVRMRFDAGGVRCGAKLVAPRFTSGRSAPWIQIDPRSGERFFAASAALAVYSCTLPAAHPLATVLAEPATESYRRWEGTAFSAPGDPPPGAEVGVDSVMASRAGAGRTSVAYVRAHLPRAEDHRFGLYTISLAARPGSLRGEVEALSTDSDADTAQFSRTYLFSWLVRRLVDAQFERDPQLRPVFVTLQYR